jgi:phosphopantetheinyl transferase (holo-ACP synthase)
MPKVKLFGALNDFVNPDKELQISMSHSDNYVTVVAILYTKNGS